jgi:hypothetical protein
MALGTVAIGTVLFPNPNIGRCGGTYLLDLSNAHTNAAITKSISAATVARQVLNLTSAE